MFWAKLYRAGAHDVAEKSHIIIAFQTFARRSALTLLLVAAVFMSAQIAPKGANLGSGSAYAASDIHPEIDRLVEEMATDPLFAAIIDGDPVKKEALKRRLSVAYVSGGLAGLEQELVKIGEEFGQNRVFATLPNARPEDIIAMFDETVGIIRYLETANTRACYQWLYGQAYGDVVDPRFFASVIGDDRQNRLVKSMVDIVTNAYDQPVTYDRASAQLRLQKAVNASFVPLDQGSLQVIAGVRPPANETEMLGACRGTGDLYTAILLQDNAADTLREAFAPQQTVMSHLGFGGIAAVRQVFKAGDPENTFAGKDLGLINALR